MTRDERGDRDAGHTAGAGAGAGPGATGSGLGAGTGAGVRAGTGGGGGTGGDGGGRPAPEAARLERSRGSKVVAGVCGGLGRHYDVDPVVLRVPVAVLSLVGGLGLLLYGVAWLLVPQEGEEENEGRRLLTGRVEGSSLAALLCTLAGTGLMLAALGGGQPSVLFPMLLLAALAGGVVWSRNRHEEAEARSEPLPHAPPEAQAPPVPHAPSWWRDPLAKDAPAGQDTGYLWGPDDADAGTPSPAPDPYAAPVTLAEREPGPAPVPARRRRRLGWLVVPAALVAGGIGTAAAWDSGELGTALVTGSVAALCVLVAGMLVSVFAGRFGFGTVLATLLAAGVLAGAALLPPDVTTDWTRTTWAPATAADVRPAYRIGNGETVLDLSGIDLAEGQTVRSAVHAGVGEIRVIVPENTTLRLDLRLGAGGYRVPAARPDGQGRVETSGGGVRYRETLTLAPRGDAAPTGTVRLDVDLTLGEIVVEHAIVEPAS
ncbi:PspC domain-containing protein [Streptomyces sp. TRM70308]|uniref:PspC domain-containing protein n=1 Tax=Streptomyces sp. TRM70308 TaxID=3131932 RepID=UPI003D07E7CE